MNKAFILQLLRTKYLKLGLSEKALNALADKILSDLGADAKPDEAQTAVDGVEFFAKLAQSEADVVRTQKAKEVADKGKDKADGGDPEPANQNKDDDTPAWAKKLIERTEKAEAKLAAMEQGRATETRRQAFERELEGLPDTLKTQSMSDFDRLSFKDDEDFTGWLEGKKTGLADLKTANDVTGAANFTRTQRAAGTGGAEKPSAAFENYKASQESKTKEVQAKSPFS